MSAAIESFGVKYSYAGTTAVLEEVNLELGKAQVVALLGANGSGKSTLLRILSGVLPLRSESGVVRVNGMLLADMTARERASRVVYVGADLRAEFPMTAFEAVSLGGTPAGRRAFGRVTAEDEDRIEGAMRETFCWNLRHRELATLSGGERQMVALARARVQGGKILLLDEALSKMDLHHQSRMGEWFARLRESGHTVVLVAHDWNLACEWADQAVVLAKGRVRASGPVHEVVTRETLADLYPGAALTVGTHPGTGSPKVFFGRS